MSSFYGYSIITINYEAFLASVLLRGIHSHHHDRVLTQREVRMHSEVSHHLSSVEAIFFPHLMTLRHQGLHFAFSFSRGLAIDCFVGIISLSKNSASNPDVCGSNLYLQRDRKVEFRAGLPPTPANTVHSPCHRRMVPHVLAICSYS